MRTQCALMHAAFSCAPFVRKYGEYFPACGFSVTAVFNGGAIYCVYLTEVSPSRALIIERRKVRSFTDGAVGNFTER